MPQPSWPEAPRQSRNWSGPPSDRDRIAGTVHYDLRVDPISERLSRPVGELPRASAACYGAAILHAAGATTYGLIDGDSRVIAIALAAAFFGAVAWVAIGTAIALLAQIADRPSRTP